MFSVGKKKRENSAATASECYVTCLRRTLNFDRTKSSRTSMFRMRFAVLYSIESSTCIGSRRHGEIQNVFAPLSRVQMFVLCIMGPWEIFTKLKFRPESMQNPDLWRDLGPAVKQPDRDPKLPRFKRYVRGTTRDFLSASTWLCTRSYNMSCFMSTQDG
jgi:hypothetical protein